MNETITKIWKLYATEMVKLKRPANTNIVFKLKFNSLRFQMTLHKKWSWVCGRNPYFRAVLVWNRNRKLEIPVKNQGL